MCNTLCHSLLLSINSNYLLIVSDLISQTIKCSYAHKPSASNCPVKRRENSILVIRSEHVFVWCVCMHVTACDLHVTACDIHVTCICGCTCDICMVNVLQLSMYFAKNATHQIKLCLLVFVCSS